MLYVSPISYDGNAESQIVYLTYREISCCVCQNCTSRFLWMPNGKFFHGLVSKNEHGLYFLSSLQKSVHGTGLVSESNYLGKPYLKSEYFWLIPWILNLTQKTNCRYYRIRSKWHNSSSICVPAVEEGMLEEISFASLRNWKVFADIYHATKEAITIVLRSGSRGN